MKHKKKRFKKKKIKFQNKCFSLMLLKIIDCASIPRMTYKIGISDGRASIFKAVFK